MSEWKKVKLDDCLELITYGFTNPMPDTLSGPWKVTAKDINNGRIVFETARHTSQEAFDNDLTDKSRPKKGDILLTKDGTLGRLAIVGDERVCINQSVALLRVNKDILSVSYLYYLLSTPLYQAKMLADAGGAAIKHIYITRVNQLLIPCPSYDEQCLIANILSRYDSLIENYQKQIKLLEEAAQRLYKEWFVDLHFPGHENTKIVDGLPEGWEKKRITDLLEIKYGKDHKKLLDGNIPVYGTGGIMRYGNSSLYTGESVLIPRKGSLNNIMLVDCTFWTIDTMFYSIPKIENSAKIAYFYLCEHDMYSMNIGAAVPSMTINILNGMELLLPTDNLRREFEKFVGDYYRQITSLQSQIRLLTEARDRLLPKLMSGEINVE